LNRDQTVKIARLTGCKNFVGKRQSLYSMRSLTLSQRIDQRNTNAQDDTAQSAARSNSTEKANVPVVLVRFRNQRVRNTVISRRKVLKGITKNFVVEDLTALNVSTLNRLQKDALVAKCWSWNGRLFASTTNARVLLVKPFQLIQECLDITR